MAKLNTQSDVFVPLALLTIAKKTNYKVIDALQRNPLKTNWKYLKKIEASFNLEYQANDVIRDGI